MEVAMVRRPTRRSGASKRPASATRSTPSSPRDAAIAALLQLLAEKRFEEIGLGEVAESAKVSLADLRGLFNSTLAIFAAHVKDNDRKVLAGGDGDMAEEPPHDRLFDVLMRRIEIMTPHRAAMKSMMRSAARNPGLALALNAIAVNSQQWMLTAAGISASGPKGMVRAQGLAVLFADVLRTFADDDEDNARTMAALDRALTRGQRWSGLLDDLCHFAPRPGRWLRRRVRDEDESHAA
jgi:AcrR family transcriptional regulator